VIRAIEARNRIMHATGKFDQAAHQHLRLSSVLRITQYSLNKFDSAVIEWKAVPTAFQSEFQQQATTTITFINQYLTRSVQLTPAKANQNPPHAGFTASMTPTPPHHNPK